MSGVTLNVTVEDKEVSRMLADLGRRMDNLRPVMAVIGSIIRTSIVRNFEKSGRQRKWKKHSKTTEKKRGEGAKILQAQGAAGGLSGSIHSKAYKDKVIIGTNKIYAAVHQFGAKKGSFGTFAVNVREHLRKASAGKSYRVRAHTRKTALPWGDIPKRPFMMVQDEDWTEIMATINEYITKGGA